MKLKGLEVRVNSDLIVRETWCRSKLGHYEKAVEDCNAALDAQPLYTKALLRRAHSYSKVNTLHTTLCFSRS
jgi:DnaJ family protein C protein 7